MKFDIEWDASRWRRAVRDFPRTLAEALAKNLDLAIRAFTKLFQESRLRGRPGLKIGTGHLYGSFKTGVTPRGTPLGKVEAWAFSLAKYAPIHETGGVIRPRRREYLAIPLPGARTLAGDLMGRFVGTEAGSTTPTLRGVPNLTCIKSKKQNLLLVDKEKLRGGSIVPLFVLKKRVTIPPRLGFFLTFRTWIAQGGFLRYVKNALDIAWEAARRRGKV